MEIASALEYVGDLLLDGYAVCVALIMAWPHAVFWMILVLVGLALFA